MFKCSFIINNYNIILKSISSQCAHGKLSIAQKPEDYPKIFKW